MKTTFSLLLAFCLAAPWANAQDDRPPKDSRPLERVERLKKVRMIEALNLEEEQAVRFLARQNEFDKKRHEIMIARQEALDKLEGLLKDRASEAELEKAFGPLLALDERFTVLRREFFQGLSDILTVQQRARLLTFERRFDRELREAVRDTHRRRMRSDEP